VPRLVINIPYEILEKVIKKYPNLPPEEALRSFIIDAVSGKVEGLKVTKVVEGISKGVSKDDIIRLQRTIQDILNPYSAKVDMLARRIGDMIEILEALSEKVTTLEEEIKKLREMRAEVVVPTPSYAKERGRERVRRSAVEILKEQKVMFESDIASKIKNRDAFFERLKRDGAVVLELLNERVAVDPKFWSEFKDKLRTIRTSNEAEIAKILGREGLALLKALSKSAQAYFDASKKMWVLLAE